jgi:hypothetical protein
MTKFNIYDTDIMPKTTTDFFSMKVEKFLQNINKCSKSSPVALWNDNVALDFGKVKLVYSKGEVGNTQRRYRVTRSNVIPSGDYNYSTLVNRIRDIYFNAIIDLNIILDKDAVEEYKMPKDYPYVVDFKQYQLMYEEPVYKEKV